MNIKKRMLLFIVLPLFLLMILYFSYRSDDPTPAASTAIPSPAAFFSEPYWTEENLIEKSDLITVCKVTSVKKETRTAEVTGGSGKTVKVTAPVVIYELQVKEILKGKAEKEISLVVTDGTQRGLIEKGEEYLMILDDFIGPDGNTEYVLVSYQRGVNRFVEDSTILESTGGKERIDYMKFKDKIKEAQN